MKLYLSHELIFCSASHRYGVAYASCAYEDGNLLRQLHCLHLCHSTCLLQKNQDSQNEEIEEAPIGKMTECNTDTPTEHVLPLEDAVRSAIYLPYIVTLFESLLIMSSHKTFYLLPVATLLRCKSVCKTWLAIISDPDFVKAHCIESQKRQPSCERYITKS